MVVFRFMWTITFYALGTLDSIYENSMSPLPTILILENSWIYICSTNCSDEASNIEVTIDKTLSLTSALDVPYVKPYNGYIIFWRNLNNSRSQSNGNVVEYVIIFL